MVVTVDVDPVAWRAEYFTGTDAQVRDDIRAYFTNYIQQAPAVEYTDAIIKMVAS